MHIAFQFELEIRITARTAKVRSKNRITLEKEPFDIRFRLAAGDAFPDHEFMALRIALLKTVGHYGMTS